MIFIKDIICNLECELRFCFHATSPEVIFTFLILFPDFIKKVFLLFWVLCSLSSPLAWWELQLLEPSRTRFISSYKYELIGHRKCKAALLYNIPRSCHLPPCRRDCLEDCDQSQTANHTDSLRVIEVSSSTRVSM